MTNITFHDDLELTTARTHWVIHIDLNKTLVLPDSANGRSFEAGLNTILAEAAMGTEENGVWRWNQQPPRTTARQVLLEALGSFVPASECSVSASECSVPACECSDSVWK